MDEFIHVIILFGGIKVMNGSEHRPLCEGDVMIGV